MKVKILSFALIALILSLFLILSVGASDVPSFLVNINNDPFYDQGPSYLSGSWSESTGNIHGAFKLYQVPTMISGFAIPIDDDVMSLQNTYVDPDTGLTESIWFLYMEFDCGFYLNQIPTSSDDTSGIDLSRTYDTLFFMLKSYGVNPTVAYIQSISCKDGDFSTILYSRSISSSTGELVINYMSDAVLYFPDRYYSNDLTPGVAPILIKNSWKLPLVPNVPDRVRNIFMTKVFSSPYSAGSLSEAGIFKPIVYYGSDDAPSDGPIEGPTESFSRFSVVVFDFFEQLLDIHFFGGFFSIGDLIGIIFALSLLVFFVKWFAGG